MSYRDYFDIDPRYFPQVDKKIIDTEPDLWKKFYPHPSFVELLKATVKVLDRSQKLSMWVDGAYGTGKSHAVLTLKKLLEAPDSEITEYFNRYNLDDFLCKNLIAQKNDGKILICHRYGSSGIDKDSKLTLAIQEGIMQALAEEGMPSLASDSIRDSLVAYFENELNKQSFNIYAASPEYKDVLGGDDADAILEKLKTYNDSALQTLVEKIVKIPTLKGFELTPDALCGWIREIIEKNNLKEIMFIWDEFSEYFENNIKHLTGFQQIAELSATAPFCLMIVTHKSEAYFSDGDPDKKKILDRFVSPIHISLPENIAFTLMAEAMKVTDDVDLAAKWEKNKSSLDTRTMKSRTAVKTKTGLDDKDLSNVLPIHPYAALLLQHISIFYTSTARSMFNFIKNDEGDDVQAFQWFIDNFDFTSQNPFITADMLWNFFYDSGKDKLTSSMREVLSCYTPRMDKELLDVEKRVLKTILLLQSVSERMADKSDIFLPNNKNLSLAFEGTDLAFTAPKIAAKLLNDHVITRTPLTGEVFTYCCKNIGPSVDPGPFIAQAEAKTTKDLTFMTGADLRSTIEMTGALRVRYALSYATVTDIDGELKKANNPSSDNNKLYCIAAIGRDSKESALIQKKIETFYSANPESKVVVIDTSEVLLGDDQYSEFVENYAMALAIGQSDMNQRKTYENYATEVLKNWAKRIKNGSYFVYSKFATNGDRATDAEDLTLKLLEIDRLTYPLCLESEFKNVVNTMYDANSLAAGATCGINEETKGTFKSANEATKLENALKDAWKIEDYWTKNQSYISRLKIAVDKLINEAYSKGDRISIADIYDFLKKEPYGFMPCNLTAFILGFVLKDYANNTYSYSDNFTTVPLDVDKLASMISEIIKQEITPNNKYKDKFIVTLTESEKAFNKATSEIFDIEEKYCVSITETRSRIREKMKSFAFPIWLIEYAIDEQTFKTSKEKVCDLIEHYCGIANNKNLDGDKSDNDIALEIGEMCIDSPDVISDLKSVLTKDKCKEGMLEYLKVYKGGVLPSLAVELSDNGQYINHLAYKFSSDAATWVWNKITVDAKIDELIVEYETISISNKILPKSTTYQETLRAWVNKISQIKLPYNLIVNELGSEKAFFEMLYNLKKANTLLDSQKPTFYNLLKDNIGAFKEFMSNQSEWFVKACGFYLEELTDEDAKKILDDDQYGFSGTYMLEPNKYIVKVQEAVSQYKSTLGHIKLRNHWKELTDSESPKDWSNKYCMPIIIMVPDDEQAIARKVFNTINKKSTNDKEIAEAEDYISKMSYIPQLMAKGSRDMAFTEVFLGKNAVLFDDVQKVKDYLKQHIVDEPYYWYGIKKVNDCIASMAKAKYDTTGYSKAKQIIDDMPADQVKSYLKQLIQNNMVVGVEIIKEKND